jgi:hypothetical protein
VTLSVIIDIIVIAFLVPTIAIAVVLNRRLAALRSNKAELDALIQSFNDACARAEAGVRTLRSATDEATRLQHYLDRSQTLRDDLSYLLDRGTSLADRLEGGVRSARSEAPRGPLSNLAAAVGALSEAEAAGRAPVRPAAGRPAAAPLTANAGDAAAPADTGPIARMARPDRPVRDRAARQAGNAAPAEAAASGGEAAPRSKAERELLQALRSRR